MRYCLKRLLRHAFLTLSVYSLLSRAVSAEAESFHNGLSLQGFTGVLNTPNAHVTEEGWLYAQYANQEEGKWRHRVPFQDDYQFSVGMFSFVELGGRFFEAPRAGRDLSANIKFPSAPLTRDYPMLPVLAAGIQDIGGGAALLQSKYVVVSQDLWRLRLSAGYGAGPDRMDGPFAGGELKLHDWVYLLGEYDTQETNVGARMVLPQFWKVPVRFTATVKTSLDYQPGNVDIAVGLSVPLDFRMRGAKNPAPTRPIDAKAERVAAPAADQVTRVEPSAVDAPAVAPVLARKPQPGLPEATPSSLQAALAREGFLNVRVGTMDRTLVVEYENTVFNHNELDALGLVSGLASQMAPDGMETVRLVVKRRNIRVATLSMPLGQLRRFLAGSEGAEGLRDRLVFELGGEGLEHVSYESAQSNGSFLNTSLSISPGLTTFVGTEVGAFDYLLSVKPEINTQLWKGAAFTVRWDLPVSWSENLDDRRHFRNSRGPSQMDRLMLFQAMQPLPSVLLQLGGGMVVPDRYGMLNEALWSPGDGRHRLRLSQGWNEDDKTKKQSDLLLGSYRYFYAPLNLSVEAAAGKFWAEDTGYSVELKRFWEDTAVSFYFKDSKGLDDKKWRAVGVQFSLPLTPRRDMRPVAKMQLRGPDEWSYAQETTLKNNNIKSARGSLNYLAPYPLTLNPQPSQALYRSFYNRDRLSAAYVRQHIDRLKEAWLKYGTSPSQVQ